MIDNEQLVYDEVSKALRSAFDDIYIIGVEITDAPPHPKAVSIIQLNSSVNGRYSTFEKVDNVAEEEYKFDIYSNKEDQRDAKQETKEMLAVIDGVMSDLFYIRSFCKPIPNVDNKFTRRVARYKKNDVV